MKKLKKIVTLLTLAAVCLTAPAFGKITVKAAATTDYKAASKTSSGPRALLYDAGNQRR